MFSFLRRRIEVNIRYDSALLYGSPEHYFHFAWGYLFPALAALHGRDHDRETYVFQDCGPKMTPLISEAAHILGLRVRIGAWSDGGAKARDILVPRWDIVTLQPHLHSLQADVDDQFLALRQQLETHRPKFWRRLSSPDILEEIRHDVLGFRNRFLAASREQTDKPVEDDQGAYLILRRSKVLPFYAADGGAEKKGYGESRRALVDVDNTINDMREMGVVARAFDCGAHRLAEQAIAFDRCRGLAMIRGAEVANLIWARQGTPVYSLVPQSMAQLPPPHDGIAKILDVPLTQTYVDTDFPDLAADDVVRFWNAKAG